MVSNLTSVDNSTKKIPSGGLSGYLVMVES